MRIVHIVGTLGFGGIERFVTDSCLLLNKEHDVSVICLLGKRGYFVDVLEDAGIWVGDFRGPASGFRMVFSLSSLLKSLKPDVVHTHCAWSMLQQVLAVWLSGTASMILTVHSQYRSGTRLAALRRRILAQVWANRVHSIVAISEAVNRWTQSWLGLRSGKIRTIYNGIDTAKFSPAGKDTDFACGLDISEGVPILAAVGSLSEHKDIRMLISACAIVKRKGVRFCFLIIGEGSQRQVLEKFAKDQGLAEEVSFLGSRADISDILRRSQVFVHGARREGFGLVVAEAQACELPVVSTAVGGVPEIVEDGITGFLVPLGDADSLAAAVMRLLRDPAMAREMGARGRTRVERLFAMEGCVQKYEKLYQNAMGAR